MGDDLGNPPWWRDFGFAPALLHQARAAIGRREGRFCRFPWCPTIGSGYALGLGRLFARRYFI